MRIETNMLRDVGSAAWAASNSSGKRRARIVAGSGRGQPAGQGWSKYESTCSSRMRPPVTPWPSRPVKPRRDIERSGRGGSPLWTSQDNHRLSRTCTGQPPTTGAMRSRGGRTSTGIAVWPPIHPVRSTKGRLIHAKLQLGLECMQNAERMVREERNPTTYQEFPSVLLPFFSAKR